MTTSQLNNLSFALIAMAFLAGALQAAGLFELNAPGNIRLGVLFIASLIGCSVTGSTLRAKPE